MPSDPQSPVTTFVIVPERDLGHAISQKLREDPRVQVCGVSTDPVPQLFQVLQVGFVHGHDEVKGPEILRLDLSGSAVQLYSMAGGGPGRTDVGGLSHVPASGSGRVHPDSMVQAFLPQKVPEDAFSHGERQMLPRHTMRTEISWGIMERSSG